MKPALFYGLKVIVEKKDKGERERGREMKVAEMEMVLLWLKVTRIDRMCSEFIRRAVQEGYFRN